MQNISNAAQVRSADRAAVEEWGIPSAVLMERAALGLTGAVTSHCSPESRILVAAGCGNNGGDGFAAARLLRQLGWEAEVFFAGNRAKMSKDCALQEQIWLRMGGTVSEGKIPDLDGYDVIIDALFGTGLARQIEGAGADLIREINRSGKTVVSADIPSGISADRGCVMGCAVKADMTVTFSCLKPGHIIYPGREYCGRVIVSPVGNEDLLKASAFSLEEEDLKELLPERKRRSNKGTYGRVLAIAGSDDMPGAAMLCARSAYKTGCGLVEVFSTRSVRDILASSLPEAVYTVRSSGDRADASTDLEKLSAAFARAKAVCIGPGLGQGIFTESAVSRTLECEDKCVIADADALRARCFTACADRRRSPLIITPHPGEMAHLTGKSIGEIMDDPVGTAAEFAKRHHLICVLKDASTVITDGKRIFLNRSGCDGMATAGSGDVLTGMIASLLAQGMEPFMAAAAGVYLHGLAGEKACALLGARSMCSGDIADMIPEILKNY